MTSRDYKFKALRLFATVQPHPCMVALCLFLYDTVSSWILQRSGALPFVIDEAAYARMDFANAVAFAPERVTLFHAGMYMTLELIGAFLAFGFICYCLKACRGEGNAWSDLLDGFTVPLRLLGLVVLRSLIVSVLLMLFIVPGVIAMLSYSMAPYLLADHPDWTALRCLRESRRLMRGHKSALFRLHLSFFLWYLLSFFPPVSIFFVPYLRLAVTWFYLSLSAPESVSVPAGGEKPPWVY